MPTPVQSTTLPPRLDFYRDALHRLLAGNGIPLGSPDAVLTLAKELGSRPQFRTRLLSFLEGLVRREAEPVSSLELLAFLAETARGKAVDLADPEYRAPMGQLLAFVLELEEGVSPEPQRPAVVAARRPRRQLRPERTRTQAAGSEAGPEDYDEAFPGSSALPRWRAYVAVAVFCLVFGLVAGLVSRGHTVLRRAPGAERVAREAPLPTDPAIGIQNDSAAELPAPQPLGLETMPLAASARERGALGSRRSARGRQPAVFAKAAEPPARRSNSRAAERASAAPRSANVPYGRNAKTAVEGGATSSGAVTSRGSNPTPANDALERVSFHPAGRVADQDAIAKALLRGADTDGAHDLLSGVIAQHPSVVAGSAGIMAANVLSSPAPAYPPEASSSRVQGEVVIQAVVGRDGRVVEARIVSGPPLLQAAALNAVERWKYRPYLVEGKSAEIATTAIVDFRLRR